MSKKLILNGHQAKAVADAMCALNNVGAKLKATFQSGERKGDVINVFETEDSEIAVRVLKGWALSGGETYSSQGDFFGAYSELMDAAK